MVLLMWHLCLGRHRLRAAGVTAALVFTNCVLPGNLSAIVCLLSWMYSIYPYLTLANLAICFEFGQDMLVPVAGLTCLVLAPVIIPTFFVARFVCMQLYWLLQVHVHGAGNIWTRLLMELCSMFQLHEQATVSWGKHVYDGSRTQVFDCHRLGQCGSNVHIFARLLFLMSSIKCSNFGYIRPCGD